MDVFPVLSIALIAINLLVVYYPTVFYSRLAGADGHFLFTIPAIMSLPIYVARIFSPFYLDFPANDFFYFSIALFSDNLYGLAQIIVILLIYQLVRKVKLSKVGNYPFFSIDLNSKRKLQCLIILGLVMLLAAIAAMINLALVSGFGIENWIKYPRIGYQDYRRGNGHYWVLAQILLSISAFVLLHVSQTKKKFIAFSLANGCIWWFLGSKAFVLGFGAFAVAMWFYKFGKNYLLLVVISFIIFSIMIINWLINANYEGSVLERLGEIMEYFDMYPMGIMYYKEYFAGNIDLFYGEVYLSSFWSYVPRALDVGKPWVYGIYLIVDHFFPGATEAGNTPGFAGSVEQFADFGYVGLLVAPLFDLTFLMKTAATILICRSMRDSTWKTGKLFVLSIFFVAPNWTPWAGGLYQVGLMMFVVLVFLVFGLLGGQSQKSQNEKNRSAKKMNYNS